MGHGTKHVMQVVPDFASRWIYSTAGAGGDLDYRPCLLLRAQSAVPDRKAKSIHQACSPVADRDISTRLGQGCETLAAIQDNPCPARGCPSPKLAVLVHAALSFSLRIAIR